MTGKEYTALEDELNEALKNVTIEHTGDSRMGGHSYSDWTDYYKVTYNINGEARTSGYDDGGPNRGPYTAELNMAGALVRVGALREDFNRDYFRMKKEASVLAAHLCSRLDVNIKEAMSYILNSDSIMSKISDVHYSNYERSNLFNEALAGYMNEKGMSTVDLQFYEHDLGRHVGYYGKTYEPLELFDLKIKGLIPEDMPETASVTFEKADTQLDMFEDMEPSVETEYEAEDEDGVYINHETVATNNKSDLYRITLSSGDLSATFYYQDCSHEDYCNSQNNRRECKVISEEEYKSRVEAMREDAGLSDRDEEEL